MNPTASNSATRCPDKEVLVAFNHGRLSDADLETVGSHLAMCESCLAFLDRQSESESRPGGSGQAPDADSSKSSLLDDTAFERLRGDSEFQRMKARAKAIEFYEDVTADWAVGPEPGGKSALEPLPEKIGRYFVLRHLGRGGFANVYLARDPDHNRLVAIKVPRADKFKDEGQVEEFLQEARTAATLDHPHIVPVFDFDRLPGGGCFVVMKYIEGRSLEAAMKSEKFAPEESARLCATIADALDYAHQKKFVHRDIKPANILLDERNQPYIADFGLAIHEDNQRSRRGEYAGTLRYMSPEQVTGRVHHLDGRTDVWSLGVILYELLTRERPFPSRDAEELEDEILTREPKPPRSVEQHHELTRICLRCLEKKPANRFSSAAEVRDLLRNWIRNNRRRPHFKATLTVVAIASALVVAGLAYCIYAGAPWTAIGGTNGFEVDERVNSSRPSTTVESPAQRISILESEPVVIFGQPSRDPIFDRTNNEYVVVSDNQRWIARVHKGLSQPIHIRATVFIKDWDGIAGFAWQVHDRTEHPGSSNRWLTAEVYRAKNEKTCKLFVQAIVVNGGLIDATTFGRAEVGIPERPTANLELVVEDRRVVIALDDNPPLEVKARAVGGPAVETWLGEGDMSIALTGDGRNVTFKRAVLEVMKDEN